MKQFFPRSGNGFNLLLSSPLSLRVIRDSVRIPIKPKGPFSFQSTTIAARSCWNLPNSAAMMMSPTENQNMDTTESNMESPPLSAFRSIPLEDYLQEVLDVVGCGGGDNDGDPLMSKSSYRMALTEQHRKKMIRCLLGYGDRKSEFNLLLQNNHARYQWKQTMEMIHQDLVALMDVVSLAEEAPGFRDAIKQQQDKDGGSAFPNNPSATNKSEKIMYTADKFFTSLARGRKYKGSFDLLLQEVAPHLQSKYQEIVREPTGREVLTRFVLELMESRTTNEDNQQDSEQNGSSDDDDAATIYKDQLLQLLEQEFPNKGPQQPDDGGKGLGIQGELSLMEFLQERKKDEINSARDTASAQKNNMSTTAKKTMVLSNVLVKTPSKHKRQVNQKTKKQLPHVILSNVNLDRMTSEFDAMVVEKVMSTSSLPFEDQTQIRIAELWEAKASLQPISIFDCLVKKESALQAVLRDPESSIYFSSPNDGDKDNNELCEFLCDEESDTAVAKNESSTFPLVSIEERTTDIANTAKDTNNIHAPPRMCIFGSELISPEASARRMQLVRCECLLETSREAVLQALETGYVQAPDVRPYLQKLLDEARRLQPILIVPAKTSSGSY